MGAAVVRELIKCGNDQIRVQKAVAFKKGKGCVSAYTLNNRAWFLLLAMATLCA